eukprot:4831828-Amphidinium_carterae.1
MGLCRAQLLDTRALTKPPGFSGSDEDWSAWSSQCLGCVGLVSQTMHTQMRTVARITQPLHSIDQLEESLATQSRSLRFLLTQLVSGCAF